MSAGPCQFGRCLPVKFGGAPSEAKYRMRPEGATDLPPGAPQFVTACAQCLAPAIDIAPFPVVVEAIR